MEKPIQRWTAKRKAELKELRAKVGDLYLELDLPTTKKEDPIFC